MPHLRQGRFAAARKLMAGKLVVLGGGEGDQFVVTGDLPQLPARNTAPYARLLYSQLCERVPGIPVFMDLRSIEPGLDFVEAI